MVFSPLQNMQKSTLDPESPRFHLSCRLPLFQVRTRRPIWGIWSYSSSATCCQFPHCKTREVSTRDFSTTTTGSIGPMYNTSATVVQYSNKDDFSRLGTIICYSPEQEPLRKQSLHSICLCYASLLVKPTQDSQGNSISKRIRSSWSSKKERHFPVLCLKQTQHTSVQGCYPHRGTAQNKEICHQTINTGLAQTMGKC